jgi:hypothetical protein
MLREVKVYGSLAKFLGQRKFLAEISSAAEAVRFLLANFPTLEQHMAQQHYRVVVNSLESDYDELHHPVGELGSVQIIPVVGGAGGGAGKILAGVGLIAAAIVLGPLAGGFLGLGLGVGGGAVTGAIGGVAASLIGSVGVALALGGVAQLLSPTPQIGQIGPANMGNFGSTTRDSELDPQKSYSFSGIQNTSAQGSPVPLIYGETFVGSVVISAGIDIDQLTA